MENNTEHSESPPNTDSPSKYIPSEAVPAVDNSIKISYDDLAKRDIENQQELDRLRGLLQEMEEKGTKNQQVKENEDSKMEDNTNSEHQSVNLVGNLRQSLALLQSENATLSQDKREYYLKTIKLQTEIDTEQHQNESLKLQINDLQIKLKNSLKHEEAARKSLLAAENEIKSQNEAKRQQLDLLLNQKNDLEKERGSLSTTVETLRHDLATHKNDIQSANERAKAAEKRCQQLEVNQTTMKKSHDELIQVYEKQRLEAEERITDFTAEVERKQQNATDNQAQLESDNKTLKAQLADALERLQVSRNSLDKLFGKTTTSSDTTTATDTASPSLTPSGASGNLLKLMKQYEDTGKQWDDIYSDFFELQDSASRLTVVNCELTTINRQLAREKDDQQQYYNQLESEVERLRTERASQSSISDDFTKLKVSSAQQISKLKDTIAQLEQANKDLRTSLNDTAYQLRHLLQHVESQHGSLPDEIEQNNKDLTENAHTPPTLSHDKTVFNSISDLQQRNQDLITEIHHLSEQVQEKSAEASAYAASAKSANDLLTDTSAKATTLIHEQNEKLKTLELRLSLTTSERDRLLKATSDSNHDSVVPSNTGDIQEQLKSMEQKHETMAAETEAYRQEVEVEMQELRQEIKKASMEAVDAVQNYNRSLVEINQLKQRNTRLVQVSSSRQNEIEQLRKHATTREVYVGELEDRTLTLKDEILTLNRTIEKLHNGNLSTTAQLKASNDSYQRLLLENKELLNHRTHMVALLQDMNENMGSSASGATHLVDQLSQHNDRLSGELQKLRDTLATNEKHLNELKAVNAQQWKDKYETASNELKQLKIDYLDLEKKLADANQNRLVAQKKLDEMALSAQDTTTGDSDTTGTTDKVETDGDAVSEQAKQLAAANELVLTLKKELLDLKEQLSNAESSTKAITDNYNNFTNESQNRIDQLSNDLKASNTKVDSMQLEIEKLLTEQKEVNAAHMATKQQLESANASLTKENEECQAKVTTLSNRINDLETELAASAQQLQQTEQRYQDEVSGHAHQSEMIAKLRGEVEEIEARIATSQSQAKAARDKLETDASLYEKKIDRLESVHNDMKTRLDESQKQQGSLVANIQELTSKLTQLQSAPDSVDPETITNLIESSTQQVRDVNASLRREKHIWEARYTDAQQRATRAESDLQVVQQQLSTTRVLLDSMRAEKDDITRKQHQRINDAENEAALYKENNTTLRNKGEQLEKRITELESLMAAKASELDPLLSKVQGLEQELAKSKDLVKTLQMKQKELSALNANVSPEQNRQETQELNQLKTGMESLKAQLEEKVNSLNSAEKQYQELLAKFNRNAEQLKKANEMYVQRSKLALEYKKKAAELEATMKTQKEQLDEQKKEQPSEPQAKQEPDNSKRLKEMEETLKKQMDEHNALATKYHNLLGRAKQLAEEKRSLGTSLEPLQKENADLKEQMESLKSEMEQIQQQLATKSEEASKASTLQVEIGRMKAMQSMANNKNEKLKKQVADLQQKLENHNSSPQPSTKEATAVPTSSETTPTASPLASIDKSSSPLNNTAATAFTTTVGSTNNLKRSSEEELDGQSPAKK